MISVIVPAYNESASIQESLNNIKKIMKGYNHELIVVEDCSKDKTLKILRTISGIKLIQHKKNKGYGASLKDGIMAAKGEWILIIDADSTYPAESIPELIKHTKNADMVVGARIGKNVHMPFFNRSAKLILRRFAGYICNEEIPDLNSGLRIFKKDIAMRFFTLFPDGFSFTTTITMACLTNNYVVEFVPINYNKRKKESKSSIKPFKDFFGFLGLILRMSVYFKPQKIFIPVGSTLFILGSIKGIIDFIRNGFFGSGNVMVILAGMQILFLGLLADLIIRRTKL